MSHFTQEFFINNRIRLSERLPNSLIVVSAHAMVQKSADQAYDFRQDSNFWYLCGIEEPDLLLIIDTEKNLTKILLPERNDYQNEWDGELDQKLISSLSGVKEFANQKELKIILRRALKRNLDICYLAPPPELLEPYGFYTNPSRRLLEAKIKAVIANPKDIRHELAALRQVKQQEEIRALQRAIDITGTSLQKIRSKMTTFKNEHDIVRSLTSYFAQLSADGHAFSPIVASGKNAATIHYVKNNSPLIDGSLVLFDIGAGYDGYSADISRVIGYGKVSSRQQEIWDACRDIQQYAFKKLTAGILLREYQTDVELYAEKIFKQAKCEDMLGKKFPHGFSHHLGLDTHDAGLYDEPLPENAVITVEPGIYLPKENVGVRIEDDVLIQRNGIKILSSQISSEL